MANTAPNAAGPALIVGAGITGLSAAWLLRRAGVEVVIRDAAPRPGGLLAPIDFQGLPCDQGSHRIHPAAHPLLQELTASANWESRTRKGVLVLGDRHMAYPLQIFDFLRGLGPKTAAHMGANFLLRPKTRSRLRRWEQDRTGTDEDIGFEDFVVRRVGRRAYAQFYAPYVEKVWGLDPGDISQTVAKSRVSTSNPVDALKQALRPSVPATFLYPAGGMTELIEFFETGLLSANVSLEFDTPVSREDVKAWKGPVFFSGHLSDLAPGNKLSHRGLYIVHISIPKGTVGDTDTFYLPESKFLFGRVSQPAKFSTDFEQAHCDILCAEIPQGRHGTDADFCTHPDIIQKQLVDAGIIPSGTEILELQQHFIPRVYPLYRRGWLANWNTAIDELGSLGEVLPIGRQGLFLHCNIDQCVHIADEAVRHYLRGEDAHSWRVGAKRFLGLRVRD